MKTLCMIFMGAALAVASTVTGICPPSFTTDSQTVSATCPGIFESVFVIPSTEGIVAANDNLLSQGIVNRGTGDDDIDDIWLTYTINATSLFRSEITMTFGGDLSDQVDHLFLDGHEIDAATPGPITVSGLLDGTKLTFWELTGTGQWYSSNPSQNPDDVHEFWVSQVAQPCDTPERSTLAMMAAGLLMVMVGGYRRVRA